MSASRRKLIEIDVADQNLGDVDAYCEGTVGWFAARPSLLFPDGSTVPLRVTGVLHLDQGVWRFVQWHLSQGVENEETLGFELTTTVEHLAASIQEERPDLRASAATDGTITIAFSDIEGSTELAVRLGDHKWGSLSKAFSPHLAQNRAYAYEGGRAAVGSGNLRTAARPTR